MEDYERKGFVSVWAGTVKNAADWDAYLEEVYDEDGNAACRFWRDLDISWFDHDLQEAERTDAPQTPESFFTTEFSFLASYREPLLVTCREKGLTTINAAVLLYDFAYTENRPFPNPALRFVGAFAYTARDAERERNLNELVVEAQRLGLY